ncbi:hypothetical protein [Caminibacter profundus]
MIYPIYESNQPKIKAFVDKNITPTVIDNGEYFVYDTNLIKRGSFKKLEVLGKELRAFDFYLFDFVKKELIKAKLINYQKPILSGVDVFYKTWEYNIFTKNATYNRQTCVLKGGRFKIVSESYIGFGDSFLVDKEKNVYAKNIDYFLKVK